MDRLSGDDEGGEKELGNVFVSKVERVNQVTYPTNKR